MHRIIQSRVIFSGTVQGVGFRLTVQRHAVQFNLTGWVKNLPDGSVEVIVEGPREKVESLCRRVEETFKGYIRGKEVQSAPARGEFKTFQIVY
jgi:acylphosphatase